MPKKSKSAWLVILVRVILILILPKILTKTTATNKVSRAMPVAGVEPKSSEAIAMAAAGVEPKSSEAIAMAAAGVEPKSSEAIVMAVPIEHLNEPTAWHRGWNYQPSVVPDMAFVWMSTIVGASGPTVPPPKKRKAEARVMIDTDDPAVSNHIRNHRPSGKPTPMTIEAYHPSHIDEVDAAIVKEIKLARNSDAIPLVKMQLQLMLLSLFRWT
jgi:hypothetical protein